MKSFILKFISAFLVFVLILSTSVTWVSAQNFSNNSKLLDVSSLPNEYSIIYQDHRTGIIYVSEKQNSDIQERISPTDVADIVLAGATLAEWFNDPTWENFGWVVLDGAAILPLVPSTGWFRQWWKKVIKQDAVKNAAKKNKPKVVAAVKEKKPIIIQVNSKAINKDMDSKKIRWQEKTNLWLQIDIAKLAGFVPFGRKWIKKLQGKRWKYQYELWLGHRDWRVVGYKVTSNLYIFDKLLTHKEVANLP